MIKKEAKYQTKFNHWLKEVYKKSAVFELKQTQGSSIPFDSVVPHQIAALTAVNEGTFVFKIPDAGFQNPFDCFCLTQMPAYVVLCFPESMEVIPISGFLLEKERVEEKKYNV